MSDTFPINKSLSQLSNSQNVTTPKKRTEKFKHKLSTSSSSLDSSFDNYNSEIKSILENDRDISFSSESDSELEETKANLEYLFNSKFWKSNNDSKSSSKKQKSQNNDNCDIKFDQFQNSSSFGTNNNISPINNKNEDIEKNVNGNNFVNMTFKNNNNMQFFPGLYINSPLYNPYISNMNTINTFTKNLNQNQMNINEHPLLINTPQTNQMNYNYQALNYNMMTYPQIQIPINNSQQNQSTEKTNNNSNFLPEINNKEKAPSKTQEQKNKNTQNNETKKVNQINNNIIKNESQTSKSPNNNSTKVIQKNTVVNKSKSNIKSNNKCEKQIINLDDIAMGKDKSTTVMIRNIPIKYTDKILNDDLIEFKGKYNCLYLPYDYEKNGNKGYAFINFVNPLHILYFYEKFNGRRWDQFESNKICELNCAHFQGINEIQKHAKNYRGQKKPNFYMNKNEANENMIIPTKYLAKLIKRFPKMKYTENKTKKIINVKSFE
jgi:hypothetical protein